MKNLLILLLWLASFTLYGQVQSEERLIREPIDRLFNGMHEGDSSIVHSAFAENVTMATIYKDKNGAPMIRNESGIKDFLKAVGTPHSEKWSEPIWNLVFVGPALHRSHHANDPAYYNKNFGIVFSLWDRLFGTYRRPPTDRTHPVAFGIRDVTAAGRSGPSWVWALPLILSRGGRTVT